MEDASSGAARPSTSDGRTPTVVSVAVRSGMDVDGYWALIEQAGAEVAPNARTDGSLVLAALRPLLEQLGPEEVASFDAQQRELLRASYGWTLWGAAYVICGGCSDDGFDDFRGWLLMQGRATFEGAVADPDTLAVLDFGDDGFPACEEALYFPNEVYEAATGEEIAVEHRPMPDLGEEWDFDDEDEMASRYPRLWARYGEDPL